MTHKTIVRLITFIAGLFFLLEFLIPGHEIVVVDFDRHELKDFPLQHEIYQQFMDAKGKHVSLSKVVSNPSDYKGQILISNIELQNIKKYVVFPSMKVILNYVYVSMFTGDKTQVDIKYCSMGEVDFKGRFAVLFQVSKKPLSAVPSYTRRKLVVKLPSEEMMLKPVFTFKGVGPLIRFEWAKEKEKIQSGKLQKDENIFSPHLTKVNALLTVLMAMAFLLGPINLVRSNISKIVRTKREWFMPTVFLIGLGFGIFAGACGWIAATVDKFQQDPSLVKSGLDNWVNSNGENLRLYFYIAVYGIGLALGGSSMGMLAFYLVSAAFRAFRLNNLDAGVMMTSAIIVLLGMVPLGVYLTSFLPDRFQLNSLARWIMDVPNSAVQRAVLIGAVAGVFGAGMRQWLSLGKAQD